MHITIRLAVRRLRSKSVHAAIRRVLRNLKRGLSSSFRVLGYSVQDDHLHLIVESDSNDAFGFGIRALGIRLGKRINAALSRSGRLFADRYHRRDLKTPREVRNAWAYVLLNRRRHLAKARLPVGRPAVDPFSSGGWFDGWDRPTWRDPDEPAVSKAKRWLANVGWKRWGLLAPSEIPGIRGAPGRSRA